MPAPLNQERESFYWIFTAQNHVGLRIFKYLYLGLYSPVSSLLGPYFQHRRLAMAITSSLVIGLISEV
jgi:hypothetical protein